MVRPRRRSNRDQCAGTPGPGSEDGSRPARQALHASRASCQPVLSSRRRPTTPCGCGAASWSHSKARRLPITRPNSRIGTARPNPMRIDSRGGRRSVWRGAAGQSAPVPCAPRTRRRAALCLTRLATRWLRASAPPRRCPEPADPASGSGMAGDVEPEHRPDASLKRCGPDRPNRRETPRKIQPGACADPGLRRR